MNSFTTDPVEAEVCNALALYKIALIQTNYRNFWYRFLCKIMDENALIHERRIKVQEEKCRHIVNTSSAHKEALLAIINDQPDSVGQ